jgi:death on curing protein
MNEPVFLTQEQVLYIQVFEANLTGSPTLIRDAEALQAAIEAPKATFDGQFLMDLFEMAATYAIAISHHHPFLDGNKRCAMGSALTFLAMNGYGVGEHKDEALADLLLDFLNKAIRKQDVAQYFREHAFAV